MKNVEITVEGNTLIFKIDLTKEFGPSSSGKNIIIASTESRIPSPSVLEILFRSYVKKRYVRERADRILCLSKMRSKQNFSEN